MTLVFNCRANGPLPIDIQIKPGVHVSLTCIHLCPPNREYDVVEELYIRPHLVGTGDRTFPGISFTAKVKRHPFYHIVYAAVPMGIFALIAVLTSASRKIENLNHRAHLNMILVLTAATYRVASARQLPPINYFTALDYYTLANVTFIIIAAIWSRVQMLRYGELPASTYEALGIPSGEYTGFEDLVVTFALSAAWLIAQVAFAILGRKLTRSPRIHDDNLRDPNNQLCANNNVSVPPLRRSNVGTLMAKRTSKLKKGLSGAFAAGRLLSRRRANAKLSKEATSRTDNSESECSVSVSVTASV